MNNIFHIAGWEYFQKVKRISFILYLLLFPLFGFGLIYFPQLLSKNEVSQTPLPVGFIDYSGEHINNLKHEFDSNVDDNFQPEFILINFGSKNLSGINDIVEMLDNQDLAALIQIFESNIPSNNIVVSYNSLLNSEELIQLEFMINKAVNKSLLSKSNLSDSLLSAINPNIISRKIKTTSLVNNGLNMIQFTIGLIFVLFLSSITIFSGGLFIRSLSEEKTNRLAEILLTSVKAGELLMGKILGLFLFALTQLIVWGAIGFFIMNEFGMKNDFSLEFFYQTLFLVTGIFLNVTIFISAGSFVKSEQNSQQINGYLTILILLPLIFIAHIINEPGSLFTSFLTFFPLTSASTIILKISSGTFTITSVVLYLGLQVLYFIVTVLITSKYFKRSLLIN
ncbi:MAG: ABC transporter permease [Melioribacteraceae bacterium]|nr:ABC transporter permease [Melioribacteraceae bacterium]MCF8352822.1 ABC transporter permease [Melioribacteraceae bacterium]MCF8393458.1 ABC transporter permease [Melioribacteraceae bacterium]MCF8417339.1 ABC transporter permease [Melioribacteraceae bacterium]